jgi:flavin-dependent dehydrogenase
MTIECDVLVVGAGAAGLTAAHLLSHHGFKVIILEKRDKLGGGQPKYYITEGNRVTEILNKINIKPNKISNKSEWISKNNNYILNSKIQDFYFKRGSEIESIESRIFSKLNEENVDIRFNSIIYSVKEDNNIVKKVSSKESVILTRYVIVAEGRNSKFDNYLKVSSKIFAKFVGYGAVINSKDKEIIPHAKIYFNSDIAPGGYVYSGSVKNESFHCIVIDDSFLGKVNLKTNLDRFLLSKIDSDNIDIKNYFTGSGFSGIKKTIQNNVFFIGGSAFFHDPFLGYGLNYAIESAYYAAQSIIKENEELYKSYSLKIQGEFKKSYFAREIWRKADDDFFDKLVSALKGTYEPFENDIIAILDLFQE